MTREYLVIYITSSRLKFLAGIRTLTQNEYSFKNTTTYKELNSGTVFTDLRFTQSHVDLFLVPYLRLQRARYG